MVILKFGPACALLISLLSPAAAQTLTTLSEFPGGGDGLLPYGGLVNVKGVLYGTTEYGGAAGRGAVVAVNTKTKAETVLYSFKGTPDGYFPQAGLIAVGKLLYGTTAYGGAANGGTVFSIDPATGKETLIFSFTTAAGFSTNTPLTYAGGYLYGETYAGGANDLGTIFKVNVKTGAETTLYSFAGGNDGCYGAYGALVQVGSLLYGTTFYCGAQGGGVLFSVDPNTGAEAVIHSFAGADGYSPVGGVTASGPVLYGTTAGGGANGDGTVYTVDTTAGTEAVLYSFAAGQDGAEPQSNPIYVSGTLYGTSYTGGAGFGTVYAVNASTGAETTLYSFTGKTDGGTSLTPLTAVSGTLYGTSLGPLIAGGNAGTVFAIDAKRKTETTLHDFTGPHPFFQSNSGLIASGSLLYGTTQNGGTTGDGTLYQLMPSTGAISTLYTFTGGSDGIGPLGGLTLTGGKFYGAAVAGGAAGQGTIFAYDPEAGTEATLHAFSGSDGAKPNGSLLSVAALLYGTTQAGGANGAGTVYSIDPATGNIVTLHSFTGGADGGAPGSGLIEHEKVLYGTTSTGGANGGGTVFAMNMKSGKETVLHSFAGGTDGLQPDAAVTYVNGVLYGVTAYGGGCSFGYGCGTLFAVNAKTGATTIVHAFTGGQDGGFLYSPLIYSGKLLYGSSFGGGAAGVGTLFSVDPSSATLTTLYSFTGGGDGQAPSTALLEHGGAFLGTTGFGGTYGAGTIFTLTP